MNSNFTIAKVLPTAVFLIDTGKGKSITNDAEHVVRVINDEHAGKRVFYKDTLGSWDELVHNNGTFLRFAGIAPVTFRKYASHLV